MKTTILVAALMFSQMAFGQHQGDQYILSDEGLIELFALPGCELNGRPGLFALAKWKDKEAEIVCWQYNKVIYIYAPKERTIIFDPSDVKTRGANEVHEPLYGSRCPDQFERARNRWPSMPCRVLQDSIASLYKLGQAAGMMGFRRA